MARSSFRRAFQLALWVAALAPAALVTAAPPEMQRAVQELEAEHDRATAASYTLQAGGASAASAIADAWPSLSLVAQKRAIGVLRTLADEHDEAVSALSVAARSNQESVRELALDALRRAVPRGLDGLAALLGDPEVGDRAAALLGRNAPDYAIAKLLAAMSEEGGPERRGLRDALTIAVQRAGGPEAPLSSWLASSPPPPAVASAALGLVGVSGLQTVLTSFVAHALSSADEFATAWRLLASAGAAGPNESIDAWVQSQLERPDPWMLRAAAVDAATARGFRDQARPALADPYPRVRMHAARALSGDAESMIERATLARKDVWPMVRASAVTSLRSEGEALPVVIAAVNDSMSMVRAAAIEVLIPLPHDEGWDRIHARLRASNEWPEVTAAAIEYVVAHCRTDAAESLFRVVLRAAPSNALTDDLNNAARAIEALRHLSTPEANSVIEQLRATPEVPPTLQMALDAPLPDSEICTAAPP